MSVAEKKGGQGGLEPPLIYKWGGSAPLLKINAQSCHKVLANKNLTHMNTIRAGAQKVYLCKKGHNFQPYILIGPTPTIIKMYCCQVWGVALYQKSLD